MCSNIFPNCAETRDDDSRSRRKVIGDVSSWNMVLFVAAVVDDITEWFVYYFSEYARSIWKSCLFHSRGFAIAEAIVEPLFLECMKKERQLTSVASWV